MSRAHRGQASLPALAIALLILTSVTVLALGVADGALAAADRDPTDRHVAASVADGLVDADGPVAIRDNVIDDARLSALDASMLEREFPVASEASVSVRVGDRDAVEAPNARGGTTVRRIVMVRQDEPQTLSPSLGATGAVTLPRRTDRLDVDIDPPSDANVTTVTAENRVLLHNDAGLSGEFTVDLSRFETARLQFQGTGTLSAGDVTLSYQAERTERRVLVVTADG